MFNAAELLAAIGPFGWTMQCKFPTIGMQPVSSSLNEACRIAQLVMLLT